MAYGPACQIFEIMVLLYYFATMAAFPNHRNLGKNGKI